MVIPTLMLCADVHMYSLNCTVLALSTYSIPSETGPLNQVSQSFERLGASLLQAQKKLLTILRSGTCTPIWT